MIRSDLKNNSLAKYFKVAGKGQSYLNLFYLLLSFPLGIFYFVFLVTGLALGFSLTIIWIGIPILVLVAASWWGLASLERQMAVYWLKADLPPMTLPSSEGRSILERLKEFFTTPVTWSSLLYLILKFPLGILSFTIVVVLVSLTLSFLAMPVLYQVFGITNAAVNLGSSWVWNINSLGDALIISLIGVVILPAALIICNTVTQLHSQLAKVLFGTPKLDSIQPN
jgi:hypothetical protein